MTVRPANACPGGQTRIDLVVEERLEARPRGAGAPRRRCRARARGAATRSTTDCVSETESATSTSGFARWNSQSRSGTTIAAGPVEAPSASSPASAPSPSPATLVEQLLLQREQPLRAAVEPQPRLGRLDAPARAVEQLRAEPLLERANLQETAGWVTPSRSAACEKLLRSTTAQNAASWRVSIRTAYRVARSMRASGSTSRTRRTSRSSGR